MKNKNYIQEIMHIKRLSYRQLSKLTGVSHSALQNIANFERSPTQETMIAIAKGLEVKVWEVFDLNSD